MSDNKHTPGEWLVSTSAGSPVVASAGDYFVVAPRGLGSSLADAHLIAAAPTLAAENAELRAQRNDLLAALKSQRAVLAKLKLFSGLPGSEAMDVDDAIRSIDAAIARARGAR